MDSYNNVGGPQTQLPSTDDPNPTRYFPPQDASASRPEVPNSGATYNGGSAQGQAQAQAGGYAQPQYQSHGQIQGSTQSYRVPGARDRTILALVLIALGAYLLFDQSRRRPR